jgi:hypothetical protein
VVREVLDTGAIRYPVDRRTRRRWLVRHTTGPRRALRSQLQAGYHCPQQIAPEIEALIVSLRKVWGAKNRITPLSRVDTAQSGQLRPCNCAAAF